MVSSKRNGDEVTLPHQQDALAQGFLLGLSRESGPRGGQGEAQGWEWSDTCGSLGPAMPGGPLRLPSGALTIPSSDPSPCIPPALRSSPAPQGDAGWYSRHLN